MTEPGRYAQEVPHPGHFFIGGRWVDPSAGATVDVISPATEETFVSIAMAGEADMDRAVAAAREAFDNGPWPRLSPAERGAYLRAIARELDKRADAICGIWASEMGSLYALNARGVARFAGIFDFYAGLGDSYPFVEKYPSAVAEAAYLIREPVGVVAAITPWNAPLMLAAWKVAPALIAGCTVVLKPSPEAPGTLHVLAAAVEAAGLPPGVLNVLTADRDVSERLVRDPRVDKVSFTGSSAAGRRIGAICADRVARFTLELGGKSPALLFEDYDVDRFADTLAASTALMSGQVCAALTRVIVPRTQHDRVVDALASRFAAIRVGDPFDPDVQMGPLATVRQRDRVENYIASGVAEGAKLATGGGRPAHLNRGFYVEPTVFGNVDNRWQIAREEIFGPVVAVIPADDERHAISLANDSDFGLNASVFTNDIERAYGAARAIRSGTVAQNAFKNDFSIAFGGFKQSGVGREGGVEGLLPYLESKTVLLDSPVPASPVEHAGA